MTSRNLFAAALGALLAVGHTGPAAAPRSETLNAGLASTSESRPCLGMLRMFPGAFLPIAACPPEIVGGDRAGRDGEEPEYVPGETLVSMRVPAR